MSNKKTIFLKKWIKSMAEEHAKVYVEEVLEMDEKDPKYENKQVVENYECK